VFHLPLPGGVKPWAVDAHVRYWVAGWLVTQGIHGNTAHMKKYIGFYFDSGEAIASETSSRPIGGIEFNGQMSTGYILSFKK